MLLPQLHDELSRAAARPSTIRRASSRVVSAFTAAMVALRLAAPAAHAGGVAVTASAAAAVHTEMPL
jgi:hypothetical protein